MAYIALLLSATITASQPNTSDQVTLKAVENTCYDYIDGQLEANPDRVARSLHPDLAKRAVIGETDYERFGLRRMSKEELVNLTKEGALKTPKDKWDRSCRILDITGNTASVRLETPWFVDYFHMGKFDNKWLIVNAMWHSKPKAK
jgi:Putative lumazine-binding